jgi:hypothetical protein
MEVRLLGGAFYKFVFNLHVDKHGLGRMDLKLFCLFGNYLDKQFPLGDLGLWLNID